VVAAVAVGIVLPTLFASGVPWRFRTEWLAERHQHTSSIDVVQAFAADVRTGRAGAARAHLLVADGGADPATAALFAPLREADSFTAGPDSSMSAPDQVPLAVRVGRRVVAYDFSMVRADGAWLVGSVQVMAVTDAG
jgi:hypothetical protein